MLQQTPELSIAADLQSVARYMWERLKVQSCGIFLVSPEDPLKMELKGACFDSKDHLRSYNDRLPKVNIRIHNIRRGGLTGQIAYRLTTKNDDSIVMNRNELAKNRFMRAKRPVKHKRPYGSYSLLVVPLKDRKNRFLGLLKVDNKKLNGIPHPNGRFDNEDIKAAKEQARKIVRNLENQRLFAQVENLMLALQGVQPIAVIARTIVESALLLIGGERGDLLLYNPVEQRLKIQACEGPTTRARWGVGASPPERCFVQQVWRERRPSRILADTHNIPIGIEYVEMHSSVRSEIAVLFNFRGKPAGILNIEADAPNHFDEEDVHWLRLLGRMAGIAAALADETTSYWNTLRHMIEFGASDADVFSLILDDVAQQLGLDAGLVFVWNDKKRVLECLAHCGLSDLPQARPGRQVFHLSDRSLAVKAFKSRKIKFSRSPKGDRNVWQQGVNQFDIKSSLFAIPVAFGKRVLGVLVVWSRTGHVTAEAEIQRVRAYATLAGWELAHSQIRRFQDQLPVFVLRKRYDTDRKCFVLRDLNHAYAELHGWLKDEVIDKNDADLFPNHLALVKKYAIDDAAVYKNGVMISRAEYHPMNSNEEMYVQMRKVRVVELDGTYSVLCVFWEASEQDRRAKADELKVIQQAIRACATLDELFEYCVDVMPKATLFRAKYASIFTMAECGRRIDDAPRKLVLRRTNHPNLIKKDRKRQCFYTIDSTNTTYGLTSWIALNNKSVLLQDMADPSDLDRQLLAYSGSSRITHSSLHCDSDPPHSTFLGVPITIGGPGDPGMVLGVLRLTQKEKDPEKSDDPAIFTPDESVLLTGIARDFIAPRLMQLLQTQYQSKLTAFEEWVSKPKMLDLLNTDRNLPAWIGEILRGLFPAGRAKKSRRYWYDQPFPDDGRYLRKFFGLTNGGGDFRTPDQEAGGQLSGSLSERVLSLESRSACITDFREKGDSNRAQNPILTAKVEHDGKVALILCVSSTRFDIDQLHDGLLLELVAGHVAQELARRTYDPAFSFAMFKHDTLNELSIIENWLQRWAVGDVRRTVAEIRRTAVTMTLISRLAQAYELTSLNAFRPYIPRQDAFPLSDVLDLVTDRRLLGEIAKGAQFKVRGRDIELRSDKNILTAILYNLIKNALTYGRKTDRHAILILNASVESGALKIIVADEGPGIPEAALRSHLGYEVVSSFEERWRSSSAREHQLGLPYVAFMVRYWCVEGRRGTVEYISGKKEALSSGANFRIILPVAIHSNTSRFS